MFIMRKLSNCFNFGNSAAKSVKDSLNISTWLHGDDSKLIFLVDPNKESFVVVVEDTSVVWPVTVQVTSFEETISFSKDIKN